MADASPQGRLAVAKALRELTAFGYYRVHKVRREDGTFVSEAHVYDTPQQPVPGLACQVVPGIDRPGSGGPTAGGAGSNPVKNRRKEPSLPGRRRPGTVGAAGVPGGTGEPSKVPVASKGLVASKGPAASKGPVVGDEVLTVKEVFGTGVGSGDGRDLADVDPSGAEAHGVAVATLFRVIGSERRLRLGAVEALGLAPLVSAWLERGYDQRDLAGALLEGLPARVYSAREFLRDRLTRKLPPPPEPSFPGYAMPEPPPGSGLPRWAECDECRRPVPDKGLCHDCAAPADRADHPRPDDDTAIRARTAVRGRALVRAALRTT
ncbi:hypothetical protein ACFYXM_06790 [Streptomyces sp. NPDC002476]|uniref:hypothetical protein n=1 Tax=Streptomyces sp. NPDC002476 TaxID=3364648 RepID=UPI0036851D80